MSDRQQKVLEYLKAHNIPFSCYEHPEGKTIEEAKRWWKDDGSRLPCKHRESPRAASCPLHRPSV